MKINNKQHITKKGVIKRNPPSANKTILLKLKNDKVFSKPEWRTIAHEKDEGKINDDEIYFYVPNLVNFNKIKIGDIVELDEDFVVVDISREFKTDKFMVKPNKLKRKKMFFE